MATKLFYILNTTAVTPNFWGNLQEGGSAPTGANTAYGWTLAKTSASTSPFWRSRLGAVGPATVASSSSTIDSTTSPTVGTGSAITTAGDSFIAGPYTGTFANANWTFAFNMRAGVAGGIGRIRLRVWKSVNANGSSPTALTGSTQVGSTVTLSTTTDQNSAITWTPGGAFTFTNEYLFFQVEWNETTTGTSNTDNCFFRAGTATITTSDFAVPAVPLSVDWTASTTIPAVLTFTRPSTAWYWNSSGVLSSAATGVARFNYDPNTLLIQGLLTEEARTNWIWDGNFASGNWSAGDTTVASATGPDGGSNGRAITAQTSTAHHTYEFVTAALSTAAPLAFSCLIKPGIYSQVGIRNVFSGSGATFTLTGAGTIGATFNGTNGTVSSPGIQYLGSSWYRVWFSETLSISAGRSIGIDMLDGSYVSGDIAAYTFTGSNAGIGMTIFDPQMEDGTFPTSPILTTGSAVARSADIISTTDAGTLSNAAWVMETIGENAGIVATVFGVNTIVGMGWDSTNHLTTANGGTQTTATTRSLSARNRSGIAWDAASRVSISLDGSAATTAANTAVAETAFYFGNTNNGASAFLNGHIRTIDGSATLTDVALAAATTTGAPIYMFPRNRHYVRR